MAAAEAARSREGKGVREGDMLGGVYRIGALLGEGAMGRVFRARHLVLGHAVAIKVLNEVFLGDELQARFVREAKATMALRSEHVVRVFDLGIGPHGVPYMVLELLEGTDLRSELRARGALPPSEAVDFVLQACEGLAEAHAKGIVHRDVKPQNMFVTRRPNGAPCVKVLDFGISKLSPLDAGDGELTSSQMLLGSPAYVSPEQIRNPRTIDARADIWSLGVVLYMLVGGGRPFDGEGAAAMCAAIVADPPAPLAARCPNVPRELEQVIFACLEKKREHRPQSVVELARRLAPFASTLGKVSVERLLHVLVAPPTFSPPQPEATSPSARRRELATLPTVAEPAAARVNAEPRRRSRALPVLGAIAAAIAIAAGAWGIARARQATAASAALPPTSSMPPAPPAEPAPAPPASTVVAEPEPSAPRPKSTTPPAPARTLPAALPSTPAKPRQLDRNGVPILD